MDLPPEIRNAIFGLAVTASTPVLIRKAIKYVPKGEVMVPVYRLQPGVPALVNVCRETRNTVPSLYFANNTFYFSDAAFEPKALRLFFELHGQNLRFIERIMVRHSHRIVFGPVRSFECQTKFVASLAGDGTVEITECSSEVAKNCAHAWENVQGITDSGMCTRRIEELAAAQSTTKELALQNGAVYMLLVKYVEGLERGGAGKRLEACTHCGKLTVV